MTATQKQAVVDRILDAFGERTQWSRWYRRNACAVHGVEYDAEPQPIDITIKDERPPATAVPQTNTGGSTGEQTNGQASIGNSSPVVDPSKPGIIEQAKQSKWLMPLLTAATIAAGAGGGWAINEYLKPDVPVISQPDVSLLQELEDRGLHLGGEQ